MFKLSVREDRCVVLKEIYNGISLETEEGNQLNVCMRDDTLEMNVCPKGVDSGHWWRVDMQTGRIEPMERRVKHGGA